jgi:hypothetical protein
MAKLLKYDPQQHISGFIFRSSFNFALSLVIFFILNRNLKFLAFTHIVNFFDYDLIPKDILNKIYFNLKI